MFPNRFQIEGYEKQIPAGASFAEINEGLIQELSFPAYRRVSTTLLFPGLTGQPGGTLFISVAQTDLDDAQLID